MKNMTLAIPRKTLLVDAALLAGACLIPAASHLLALPLYMLDPMRWLLIAAIVMGYKDDNLLTNGLLMALLLPLVSCAVVGMPTMGKALIIMAELGANVALFALMSKKMNTFLAMLLSIVAAKGLYYGLKGLLLGGALLGTSWMIQLAMALAMAGVMALILKKK